MNTHQTWRKSSYSNAESVCVELSVGHAQTSIRDSKSRAAGMITVCTAAFAAFVRSRGAGASDSQS